jgi:hypothetical protein
MTSEQALAQAQALAATQHWTWLEPVKVRAYRSWWVGPLRWRVVSNAQSRGCNVVVEIDDRSEQVQAAHFLPR